MTEPAPDFAGERADLAEARADFGEAIAHHRAGRLAEAEAIYQRILAAHPDHFDSLHLLGVVALQRGNAAAAVCQIDAALRINPTHILALNNRGNALQELRRFEEALTSYDQALQVRPDYAEALTNRGATLNVLGRFDEALASFDRALLLRPDFVEAHSNRGNALKGLKRLDEALASFDRALLLRPDYAEAHYNRGNTLHAQERFEEALASHDRALALRPDYADALANRGASLNELKRFEEALASYDQALAVRPNDAEALTNRGVTLNALKRFDQALIDHDHALALSPDNAKALANRGVSLHDLERFDEALASYERAVALRPDFAEALTNRGVTLHSLKRFEEELTSYDRALAVQPDYAQAHFNAAVCRLLLGDFGGLEQYEWRWATDQLRNEKRNFAQPLLTRSSDVAGRTVLLHAEQGFGDTIQFCRYAPLLAARGAHVILEVQQSLTALMGTLSGVAQVVAQGGTLPAFDLHCPLLGLPLAMAAELTSIPSRTPYLGAPVPALRAWQASLGATKRPRIGLAWSGNRTHHNDRNRSIALAALRPLFDLDASFISLQREVSDADSIFLRSRRDIVHFGAALNDFTDTAALISLLDLVISVDTGIAHLAGALAKPIWVLLPWVPDWRWLLDRDDSPWYPTARLFRQAESRGWDDVIVRVHAALRQSFAA